MVIKNFAYEGLMKYFEEISAIPRASYKEERIADYLCDFAKARGLEFYRDSTNNVLINAPAAEGYESVPALLLQGHTDMVCEKNDGVEHDFDKDGIDLYEEDGWIKARGTTLGADNGVAVASMLYILDGGVEGHGALQCLFTASEEVGLDGVQAMDFSRIYARRMLNMDSADENQIIAGCAGGIKSELSFESTPTKVFAKTVAEIAVRGLFGGHSGEDINKGRANALKLMGRVLYSLMNKMDISIVSINGGSKDNAIPRECVARIVVDDLCALKSFAEELGETIKGELCADDSRFALEVRPVAQELETDVMDRDTARSIVFLMNTASIGVHEMNYSVEGLVEWSSNMGVIRSDAEKATVVFSSRSSLESRLEASTAELSNYAEMLGAKARHYNGYPGWSYAPVSEMREEYVKAYGEVIGGEPEITVIHAGLECGFVSQAVPDMDIISCGPVVLDLHSPDERLNKASFERFFTIVKKIVEKK